MEEHDKQVEPAPGGSAEDLRRVRRRLLQGSVGAAPLIMTLVSRPVLGQTQCFSPSAFSSMRTSQHGPAQLCSGRAPDYWRAEQNFGQWTHPYYAVESTGPGGRTWGPTLFTRVFSPAVNPSTATFLDVLNMESGGAYGVACYLVASVLNVAKTWVPPSVLTVSSLQMIWAEYTSRGYFEPTAGVKWDGAQIVAYLRYTMGYPAL